MARASGLTGSPFPTQEALAAPTFLLTTKGLSIQRLPTPRPKMAPGGAKEASHHGGEEGARGRVQRPRPEEAGLGSPSVALGHMGCVSHNQGNNGKQVGNSASQPDVFLEEAGHCVGPLPGRFHSHVVLETLPNSPHQPTRLQTLGGGDRATLGQQAHH